MFQLTKPELDCAKAAIEHHRYSTLLPEPPEWNDVSEHWPVLRSYLCGLNLERYTPREPLAITVAKDAMSVRLVHLLHPEDMLLYTALTMIVKEEIEGVRAPRTKRRVYPYRASESDSRLYDSVGHTHERYMDHLRRKAQKRSTMAIAVTDIADFYASISQTQLKDLLKQAAGDRPRNAKAADLLVSKFAAGFMPREGQGIPTGPLASRLLAEIVLNEIDKHLMSRRVDFVRWVDDYNIFAPSVASARAILRDMAVWLYGNCGLTLQTAKTHVLTKADYAKDFLTEIEDEFPDRSKIVSVLRNHGYESTSSMKDAAFIMDDLLAVELLEMLVVDAISSEEEIDHRAVGFVVRRLRKMTLDRAVAREVMEVLVENIDQLAPVIAEVAPLIASLLPMGRLSKRVAKRLFASLRKTDVDHHAVWILTMFAKMGRKTFLDGLRIVYQEAVSNAVKRFAILAIAGCGGGIPYKQRDWERLPPLVRLALLKFGGTLERRSRMLGGKLEELVAVGS